MLIEFRYVYAGSMHQNAPGWEWMIPAPSLACVFVGTRLYKRKGDARKAAQRVITKLLSRGEMV